MRVVCAVALLVVAGTKVPAYVHGVPAYVDGVATRSVRLPWPEQGRGQAEEWLPASLARATSRAAGRPQTADVPPLSFTCPMHPDVVEGEKGICPLCKMALVPVRLDSVWSCPVHAVVTESRPGKCPICRRDLGQVTVMVAWTCPDRPEIDRLEPGTCPDGTPAQRTVRSRPHGNHNPLHGGLFFMAPDNWHHLEGTYSERGVFRMHLYDDYTKPLLPGKVKQATGRLVTHESFDNATRTTREISAFQLTPSANGQYLEAKIDPLSPPAKMTAKVKLAPDGPEYRFDFAFQDFSKEPVGDPGTPSAPTGADPSQLAVEIPAALPEVLEQLHARNAEVGAIVQRESFTELWLPALQAKDLALALEAHAATLSPAVRQRVAAATKRVVISAWRLDAYGDLGNREQIGAAYTVFAAAVAQLESEFRARK